MSVAALEAEALGRCLRELAGDSDLYRKLWPVFLAGADAIIDTAWSLSAHPDLRFPQTEGERPKDLAESEKIQPAITRLTHRDAAFYRIVMRVVHLAEPRSVLAPYIERALRESDS